jgi:hypothetical protein
VTGQQEMFTQDTCEMNPSLFCITCRINATDHCLCSIINIFINFLIVLTNNTVETLHHHWMPQNINTFENTSFINYTNYISNDIFEKLKIASDQSNLFYKEYNEESLVNTNSWIYQRWIKLPSRSKRPLSTHHTHTEVYILIRLTLCVLEFKN